MRFFLAFTMILFGLQARAQTNFSEDEVTDGGYRIQPHFQSGGSVKPLPYEKAGVTPDAFEYLKQCQAAFSRYMGDRDKPIQNIILADFSDCMEQPRFYVLKFDTAAPERSTVELRTWVSHGSGSGRVGPQKEAFKCTRAKSLSDGKATQQTPSGCMRVFGAGTAGFMPTYPSLRGFYVSGLEKRNECSYAKGIRIHNYPEFANPRNVQNPSSESDTHRIERVTNSSGCMRVDDSEIDNLKPYIDARQGTLLVNYPGTRPNTPPRQIVPRPNLERYIGSPMQFEARGNRDRRCVEGERAPVDNVIPGPRAVHRGWYNIEVKREVTR